MTAWYNEIEPFAAQWLRNLIAGGHIAPGDVDERDIRDVRPDEIRGYTQCHFFAGIGGWPLALRMAGWPDDRPVWTGSCPCQPFSAAGKGAGFADERHLWPSLHHLIRLVRPGVVFGEQVPRAVRLGWLDLVQDDLENLGYAFAAAVACAVGAGAPHIRPRIMFAADADGQGRGERNALGSTPAHERATSSGSGNLAWDSADPEYRGCQGWDAQDGDEFAGPTLPPNWWSAEPALGESPDGLPNSVECFGPGFDTEKRDAESLRALRSSNGTSALLWPAGRSVGIQAPEILQSDLRQHPGRSDETRAIVPSAETPESGLRGLREYERFGGAPHRPEQHEQHSGKHPDLVQLVPRFLARDSKTTWADGSWENGIPRVAHGVPGRVGQLRAYGNAIVPQVAEAWIRAYLSLETEPVRLGVLE